MNNISLKSIKYESIKSIFNAIADSEKISRSEISGLTDLSLVTIGKIADALVRLKVITEDKEIKSRAGRRAGLLRVNTDKFAVILDITSYEFRLAVLNLRLDRIDKSRYSCRENLSFEENLNCFLAESNAMVDIKYSLHNCIGVGVAVPGPYNEESGTVITKRVPELEKINIASVVRKHFPNQRVIIDSQVNAAAKSNVSGVEDYLHKNIVYWYIGDSYVCGAYLVGGQLILGKDNHACQFGNLHSADGERLETRLAACTDIGEYTSLLSNAIYNIVCILSPHMLIIEYDSMFCQEDIIPLITKKLSGEFGLSESELPEFRRACCKFRNSHRGLTVDLRSLWLEEIVSADAENPVQY